MSGRENDKSVLIFAFSTNSIRLHPLSLSDFGLYMILKSDLLQISPLDPRTEIISHQPSQVSTSLSDNFASLQKILKEKRLAIEKQKAANTLKSNKLSSKRMLLAELTHREQRLNLTVNQYEAKLRENEKLENLILEKLQEFEQRKKEAHASRALKISKLVQNINSEFDNAESDIRSMIVDSDRMLKTMSNLIKKFDLLEDESSHFCLL